MTVHISSTFYYCSVTTRTSLSRSGVGLSVKVGKYCSTFRRGFRKLSASGKQQWPLLQRQVANDVQQEASLQVAAALDPSIKCQADRLTD